VNISPDVFGAHLNELADKRKHRVADNVGFVCETVETGRDEIFEVVYKPEILLYVLYIASLGDGLAGGFGNDTNLRLCSCQSRFGVDHALDICRVGKDISNFLGSKEVTEDPGVESAAVHDAGIIGFREGRSEEVGGDREEILLAQHGPYIFCLCSFQQV
jgi:hypothetical protein